MVFVPTLSVSLVILIALWRADAAWPFLVLFGLTGLSGLFGTIALLRGGWPDFVEA